MDDAVLSVLRTIIDPDVGINIVDLGLVEDLRTAAGQISLGLVMTSPACPQSGYLVEQAQSALETAFPQAGVAVDLVGWPDWSPARMSATARTQLGWPA